MILAFKTSNVGVQLWDARMTIRDVPFVVMSVLDRCYMKL